MPTVLRRDGFRVRILLPPREHGPPHVHVYKAGGVVVITLPNGDQPLRVRSIRRMRNTDVVGAFRLVEEYVDRLIWDWSSYHGETQNE